MSRQEKRRPGRPHTFSQQERAAFAKLIRKHGINGARRLSPVPISRPTLGKVAREFEIELKSGKRPHSETTTPSAKMSKRP